MQDGEVKVRFTGATEKSCVIRMVAYMLNINPSPVADVSFMHSYAYRISRAIVLAFDTMCRCKHMISAYQSSSTLGIPVIDGMIKNRYLPRNGMSFNLFSTPNPSAAELRFSTFYVKS